MCSDLMRSSCFQINFKQGISVLIIKHSIFCNNLFLICPFPCLKLLPCSFLCPFCEISCKRIAFSFHFSVNDSQIIFSISLFFILSLRIRRASAFLAAITIPPVFLSILLVREGKRCCCPQDSIRPFVKITLNS